MSGAGVMGIKVENRTAEERIKLEVPKIAFYNGSGIPEDDPFPQSIKAFLQYKKDTLGLCKPGNDLQEWHKIHCFAMGTSGAGVRNCWLDYRNLAYGFDSLAADPTVGYVNTIEAIGYEGRLLLRKTYAESIGQKQAADYSEAEFKKQIVDSVTSGNPVLAIGVVGPPEVCLITGYDKGGEVLIGWSCFQTDPGFDKNLEKEPTGEFRKSNWYDDTVGIIVIGKKKPKVSIAEADKKALQWAVKILKAKTSGKFKAGQDAYEAWISSVRNDTLYEKASEDEMKKAHEGHWGNAGILAQARAWGGQWLDDMAERHPEVRKELTDASGWFFDIHDLVWAMWEFMGGYPQKAEQAEAFRSAYLRSRVACLIRIMAKCDKQAIPRLEVAIRKLKTD